MIILYGIKNCDTVKKARKWLESNNKDYHFHDFREDGLDKNQVNTWLEQLGWEAVVNKRSTTWRNLSDKEKEISSNAQAARLLLANPTLIKRPVVEKGKTLIIGFKEAEYKKL